jgi:hypothetical protein
MDYKTKYLKYKTKYLNLQQNILSFKQIGGAPNNIIIGCSSLNVDSTFE